MCKFQTAILESYNSIPAFVEMVLDLFLGNFINEETNENKKQIKKIALMWTARAKADSLYAKYVPLFEKIEKELAEKYPTT